MHIQSTDLLRFAWQKLPIHIGLHEMEEHLASCSECSSKLVSLSEYVSEKKEIEVARDRWLK